MSPTVWTSQRLDYVRKLRGQGMEISQIAFRIGSTEDAIRNALRRKLSPYQSTAESHRAGLERVAAEMRARSTSLAKREAMQRVWAERKAGAA